MMRGATMAEPRSLGDLFPASSRVLLTGTGKQFIERVGVETAREVVLNVLMGENVRTQTEPLTRQRITQISAAVVAMFFNGYRDDPAFSATLSARAAQQLTSTSRPHKTDVWLAQWLLGLTDKGMQNILRRGRSSLPEYTSDFERALQQAAAICQRDLGDLRMTLGYAEDDAGQLVELGWKDILHLTTAIGSQTLTISRLR